MDMKHRERLEKLERFTRSSETEPWSPFPVGYEYPTKEEWEKLSIEHHARLGLYEHLIDV
jgi:hypothetical protein